MLENMYKDEVIRIGEKLVDLEKKLGVLKEAVTGLESKFEYLLNRINGFTADCVFFEGVHYINQCAKCQETQQGNSHGAGRNHVPSSKKIAE